MPVDAASPVPEREEERLQALGRYKILDTPPEEAFDRFAHLAATAFSMPIALISLVDRGRQWFKARHGMEDQQTARDVAFCAHAICGDQVLVVPDTISDPRFAGNPLVTGDPKIRFYAGAPLRTKDGYNLGTLCVLDHEPRVFPGAHAKLLEEMAALVMNEFEIRLAGRNAVAELSEKEKYANELYRLATTDSLTGALNRRAFLEIVEKEFVRARRYQRPLSILSFDVDNFKDINDRLGHATGDAVLKALVAKARRSLRAHDVLGRVGGDEFAILLPETPAVNALILANRLREVLGSIRVEIGVAPVRFTVSVGVTECHYGNDTVDDALRRADVALYAAKKAGRNRVELQLAA